MMTCFDQCLEVEKEIFYKLYGESHTAKEYKNETGLTIRDTSFYSKKFARGHLSIVDARETKSIFLLHCTIIPNQNDPSPIFGFDIISGPKKVSGAFHDLSPTVETGMTMRFNYEADKLTWNKRRPLPDWAKEIFSEHIVAIGAVGPEELSKFIQFGLDTLNYYLTHVGVSSDKSYIDLHNRYCANQRLNEHTPRALVSLGMTEEQAKDFVYENLFPMAETFINDSVFTS